MVKTMSSKSVSWKSQKWILMWTYMRSVLNLAHFHILFSWLWSFILHLCELSLRAWRCSVSRLPHSLRTKALSCWRALTVFYGPSHLSQLQNYEIDARFFFFSIFQIRKLRLKMFGKLSQVTQPINVRGEISIQRVRIEKPKPFPKRLFHAIRETQIEFCLAFSKPCHIH